MNSLFDILKPARLTEIVDIGASPIDGVPPYKVMLDKRLCRVTGFEPHAEAFKQLLQCKGELERYLPDAIGDGSLGELKICHAPGMTSLLEPNQKTLKVFGLFEVFGKVLRRMPIQTRTLDSVSEIEHMDFLKIDIQGGELSVFKHGEQKLKNAVAVQTEVSFVALYNNQPTIGEIDIYMRAHGFIPHCFSAGKNWIISPMVIDNEPRRSLNQLLEADIVYVRNFIDPTGMEDEQLKHLGMLAHYCYGSYDLTMKCIALLQERGVLNSSAIANYTDFLGNSIRPTSANPS